MDKLLTRFLNYVQFDTQSDPDIDQSPSTPGQRRLAELLAIELEDIGLTEIELDEQGYLTATLPASPGVTAPCIGLIAHLDTAPDYSGAGVTPMLVEHYQGQRIELGAGQVLSPEQFPELDRYIGHDLITTDGATLLGADDKAGIAEIITAVEYLQQHPELAHGKIRLAFTPDEEIGRSTEQFDIAAFGADWAYTVDGGAPGELQHENFNATEARVLIEGASVHPGDGYGRLVNALRLAQKLALSLPEAETPEQTRGREGFYHIQALSGTSAQAQMTILLRDFDSAGLEQRCQVLREAVASINGALDKPRLQLQLKPQYRNMAQALQACPQAIALAEQAMQQAGLAPRHVPIRGGTDGAELSYRGLPCPNIFAGGHNFHGPCEYISVQAMEAACRTLINICTGAVNA